VVLAWWRRQADLITQADDCNPVSTPICHQLLAGRFQLLRSLVADIDVAAAQAVRECFLAGIRCECRGAHQLYEPSEKRVVFRVAPLLRGELALRGANSTVLEIDAALLSDIDVPADLARLA
jgi:hypothetical protein